MTRYGKPEIFNTDQASQAFTSVLREAETRISMNRWASRWMFHQTDRRSLEYECVYPHAFETGSELRDALVLDRALRFPTSNLDVDTNAAESPSVVAMQQRGF